MKVPNTQPHLRTVIVSLSRLQNEGSQLAVTDNTEHVKSIKATE